MGIRAGISIIICCYNSAERIGNVLDHIDKQKYTDSIPWEVILVDNASEDRTADVAREVWKRRDIPLNIVTESRPGLSYAREKGLESSSYSIVIFVDDDNLLSESYLHRAYEIMINHHDVGLLGGLGIPVSEKDLPPWFIYYQSAYAVGPQAPQDGYLPLTRTYLHGAGLVMRKDVWDFLVSKGFKLLLSGRKGKSLSSGEDSEISNVFKMAGYQLWYDSGLQFKHVLPPGRLTWSYIVRLSREFGKSAVVLDIYRANIKNFTGWEWMKVNSWPVSILISLYHLLEFLPAYLWIQIRKIEGNHKEYKFQYHYGVTLQRLKLLFGFREIRNEISRLQRQLKEC